MAEYNSEYEFHGYLPHGNLEAVTVGAITGGLFGMVAGFVTSFLNATSFRRIIPSMYKNMKAISKCDISDYTSWAKKYARFEKLQDKTFFPAELMSLALTQIAVSTYLVLAITNPELFVKEGADTRAVLAIWGIPNAASLLFEGASLLRKKLEERV